MEINQARIMGMAAGFQPAKILLTANELGIFKAIGVKPMSADEVARALKLDREAVTLLMRALTGLGLVKHRSGRFANAPDVQKYLAEESEEGVSSIVNHLNHLYEPWAGLDRIVKRGRPRKIGAPGILIDRKINRDFIRGMFEIGYENAKLVEKALDLTGVKRMADIGGGPAQYPIAFAAAHPDMEFVVADYPNTIRVARGYVRKYGLGRRIRLVDCEFFDDPELSIGEGYDLALLSQVLHAASDEKCVGLIKKTRAILRTGGRIVINENAMDDDRVSPPPPLIFAINMLVNNAGRTFTVKELRDWLKAAGFRKVKSKRLHERSVLVEGTK